MDIKDLIETTSDFSLLDLNDLLRIFNSPETPDDTKLIIVYTLRRRGLLSCLTLNVAAQTILPATSL